MYAGTSTVASHRRQNWCCVAKALISDVIEADRCEVERGSAQPECPGIMSVTYKQVIIVLCYTRKPSRALSNVSDSTTADTMTNDAVSKVSSWLIDSTIHLLNRKWMFFNRASLKVHGRRQNNTGENTNEIGVVSISCNVGRAIRKIPAVVSGLCPMNE